MKDSIYGCDLSRGPDYSVKVWGHKETDANGKEVLVIDKWEYILPGKEGVLLEIETKEG